MIHIKIGDRVLIISNKSKYKGQMATVGGFHGCYIGVYPDNAKHIYYDDGIHNKTLKLCKTSIQKIESEENRMAKLEGFNKVAVITQGNGYSQKDYYYALYDESIQCGDKVLVSGSANGQIWEVKGIQDRDYNVETTRNITAEVICKIDTSAYDERCANRKKAEELRKQMDKKRKEIEARKDDEYYASLDPDYAAMLAQMKEMGC